MNWDLDGDKKFDGKPHYFYMDTNPALHGGLRIRIGPVGIGFESTSFVDFDRFQIKPSTKDLGLVEAPWFKFAGKIRLSEEGVSPAIEFRFFNDWHKVKIPKSVVIA